MTAGVLLLSQPDNFYYVYRNKRDLAPQKETAMTATGRRADAEQLTQRRREQHAHV